MHPRFRPILLSAVLASFAWGPLVAADAAGPSQEYQDQLKELAQITENRDLDLYEMAFKPVEIDDIVIKDRLGRLQAYTYLIFQIRNQSTMSASIDGGTMPRYAEVLKSINDQYGQIATVSTEGGGKITVGDGKSSDNVVLERRDQAVKDRSVDLAVVAYDYTDRNLTHVEQSLGDFQNLNRGQQAVDVDMDLVRERIEDRADRRLHSIREIRAMKLPPFDPGKRDAEGQMVGEVFGVAIFPRFALRARHFTVEVRGLSNKLRVHVPPVEAGKPENYLAMKVLRRTMVLTYDRPGDEFHRQTAPYQLTSSGYRWIETFQRLDKRRTMAMTRFYVDQLRDADDKPKADVEAQFWAWYDQTRAAYPNAADKLPDLAATLKEPAGK